MVSACCKVEAVKTPSLGWGRMREGAQGGRVRLYKEQALKYASEDQVRTHEARVIRSSLQSKWFSGIVDRRPLAGGRRLQVFQFPEGVLAEKIIKKHFNKWFLRIDLQTSSSALTICLISASSNHCYEPFNDWSPLSLVRAGLQSRTLPPSLSLRHLPSSEGRSRRPASLTFTIEQSVYAQIELAEPQPERQSTLPH